MTIVSCNKADVQVTIDHLREGGRLECETVVLWLGRGQDGQVTRVLRPDQEVAFDRFRIPSRAMRDLMHVLASDRLRILAQIHSHPGRAFHSEIDDEWAIIRHVGAVSIVVPKFASTTTAENFLEQAAVYTHSEQGAWLPTEGANMRGVLRVR